MRARRCPRTTRGTRRTRNLRPLPPDNGQLATAPRARPLPPDDGQPTTDNYPAHRTHCATTRAHAARSPDRTTSTIADHRARGEGRLSGRASRGVGALITFGCAGARGRVRVALVVRGAAEALPRVRALRERGAALGVAAGLRLEVLLRFMTGGRFTNPARPGGGTAEHALPWISARPRGRTGARGCVRRAARGADGAASQSFLPSPCSSILA
jgi:hypothetical protein